MSMAQYVIGDLQGCYDSFRYLLEKINFDQDTDRLWLVGDLVNRGPRSRKTLRYVKELDHAGAVVTVLGNHDLHLLALANGTRFSGSHFDSLYKILAKKGSDELLDWLRVQRLAYYDKKLNTLMIHAGVPREWTVKKVLKRAAEVEGALRGDDYAEFLENMYGDNPAIWSGDLRGYDRLRFIVNALTRMRMIDERGRIDLSHSGPPEKAAKNLIPWFGVAGAKWHGTRLVFGHWSALGLLVSDDLICADTGCVWGRELTAIRLDKKPKVQAVKCRDY